MSLETVNNKLFKYEDNDNADLRFLHDSMDIIDSGISPFYVATLDSANIYKIVTGLNKTELNNGYSIKVAIPSNSTGAVSIIVDSVTVPLKQANGNPVTNFKANGVYSLTYYNSVFILASVGGADTVNFTSDKLLTGYSANNSNGEKVNGTMLNNGAKTATLNCGATYTIPAGYHNGSGKVTANSLATQMANNGVTLTSASQLISGIKAISKTGKLLTGTASIQSLGGKQFKNGTITGNSTNYITGAGFAGFKIKLDISFSPSVIYFEISSNIVVYKTSNITLSAGQKGFYVKSPLNTGYICKRIGDSSTTTASIYDDSTKYLWVYSEVVNSFKTYGEIKWFAWG